MEKVEKKILRIMSKQYARLHTMAKTSVKFQNDWPKTVGGVALTSQLLTNRQVAARLYHTCVLTQARHKKINKKLCQYLVHYNLEIICAAPHHCVTIYEVSA